jgi:3-ketoacyl-CoA synthase
MAFEQGMGTAAAIITALAYRRFDRACAAAAPAGGLTGALCAAKSALFALEPRTALLLLAGLAAAALIVALLVRALRKAPVYVVDFSVHKPDASWAFSRADVRRLAEKNGEIPQDMIDFMAKLAYRSGLGDNTAVTPAIQACLDHKPGMEAARLEYEATCFSVVEELLAKTGVKPSQIKFVITNSSLFNPTPSLSAAIMNRFKLRHDTINYSLGGMGCSAGVIALDLARQMLQLNPGTYALVVSHENITNNCESSLSVLGCFLGEGGFCSIV